MAAKTVKRTIHSFLAFSPCTLCPLWLNSARGSYAPTPRLPFQEKAEAAVAWGTAWR